tara:strand:+ start:384 stop:503 length:120 start_codon:yes stop_codon:yes gene_type:complete
MLPFSTKLPDDQIFLDGSHTELVGQHVIRPNEAHIRTAG